MLKYLKLFCGSIIAIYASNSYSYELFDRPLGINGSASLYYTSTTDDISFRNSEDNPFYFSQITLSSHYGLTNNIEIRNEFQFTENNFRINYFLADLSAGDTGLLYGIRAGKILRKYGLYGTVRLSPSKRPFIYLPSALYIPSADEWSTSNVGGQIYITKSLFNGEGEINFEYDVGVPLVTRRGIEYQFSQLANAVDIDDTDNFKNTFGSAGSVYIRYKNWKLAIAGVPNVGWEYDSQSGPLPPFESDEWAVWPSFSYTTNKWMLGIEGVYAHVDTDFPTVPFILSTTNILKGVAVVGSYNINEKVKVSAFTSKGWVDSERETLFGTVSNSSSQTDSAISLEYFINRNWEVRAEAHYLHGDPLNIRAFGSDNNIADVKEDWGLFVLGLEYRF